MGRIAAVVFMLVLLAMAIDLASGLYKAKLRKEIRTSFGFHRSIIKFITNEGAVIVAFCIDVMLCFTSLWDIFSIKQLINVPVFTILIGVYCCWVEFVSIREKADKKADKRAMEQLLAIIKTFNKKEVKEVLIALGKIKESEK